MKHCTLSYFLISALLMIIFQSCKKESAPDDTYSVTFSKHALEFVNLTQGKYLIYKDSATAVEDSVIISTSILGTFYTPRGDASNWWAPPHYTETYSLVLTKFGNDTHSEWLNGTAVAQPDYTNFYPHPSTDTSAIDLRETDNSSIFYLSQSGPVLNGINIEGRSYNNVVLTIEANGIDTNASYYKKNICYWAKGIGVIKRTLITTGGAAKTYTLLRNN